MDFGVHGVKAETSTAVRFLEPVLKDRPRVPSDSIPLSCCWLHPEIDS